MEVSISLNALVRLPLSGSRSNEDGLMKHSLVSSKRLATRKLPQRQRGMVVARAKGKRGMTYRDRQRSSQLNLPEIEDDGNPRFVIFIRPANLLFWYPLSIISGGTTAKIMVAAKDNLLGKYIYKDTIARNIAAVIYRDEKEIKKIAFKQNPRLQSAESFRYGYKLVENSNLKAAITSQSVIELPTQDKLKTVFDKVKDFFGDAKESFGKMSTLNLGTDEESQGSSKDNAEVKG